MQIINLNADITPAKLHSTIRTLRVGDGGGTSNYNDLSNKPSINSVTLTGNKTTSDLNIKTSDLVNDAGFITDADIPSKTSDLVNDSGFQTAAQVSTTVENAIPTYTSQLTNDSGYITAAQVGTIPTKTSDLDNDSGFITSAGAPVQSVNGYTGAVVLTSDNVEVEAGVSIGDKLEDIEENIPTKTSDLTNDSGFITSAALPLYTSQLTNDSGYITRADIPTDVSAFTNDAGYQTAANVNTLIQAAMPATEIIENESIASFSDGADNVPVSELIVNITATQGGWSSCNVVRCGKNLINITECLNDYYIKSSDLSVSSIEGANVFYCDVPKNTDLVLTPDKSNRCVILGYKTRPTTIAGSIGDELIIDSGSGITSRSFNTGDNQFLAIYLNRDSANKPTQIMLNIGSAATTYEPYKGTTYTIALGETLTQGGVLNVTTGLLTRTDTTTAQLTPTEVRTLLNCNIFADTGDVNKLVYFKTGCEAIARLIEAYT